MKERYDLVPSSLVVHCREALTGCAWTCRSGVFENGICPPFKDTVWYVKLPLDSLQEVALVRVDFRHWETGHLAPCLGRIVAILQVL